MPVFSFIRDAILNTLFPPLCLICGKTLPRDEARQNLCAPCFAAIPLHSALLCLVCGARRPDGKKICHPNARILLASAAEYETGIKQLIWSLKYQKRTAAAPALAAILCAYLGKLAPPLAADVIVPIPLHRKRERERGFNQAELIAGELSKLLGLTVARALKRTRYTPPQVAAGDREARHENVAGCFIVKRSELIAGKRVALLDDVATTGATLEEAARALKAAGAKSVVGLVAARAGFS